MYEYVPFGSCFFPFRCFAFGSAVYRSVAWMYAGLVFFLIEKHRICICFL